MVTKQNDPGHKTRKTSSHHQMSITAKLPNMVHITSHVMEKMQFSLLSPDR